MNTIAPTIHRIETTVPAMKPCPHCSNGPTIIYHTGACPRISAIEYFPDGTVKRVEFKDVSK